ncbi:MAG TPA: hypothetical protein VFA20_07275 [Myxococcaceae bacterium]|nr:hypothetical protein [Myxococcaceae bacterium]
MKRGAKVAVALGAAVVAVGAPVAFVVQGAGAPGRADSAETWWERLRRAPSLVLASPERTSAVQAGGEPVHPLRGVKVQRVEVKDLPARSPVVAIDELYDVQAVATFDDGAFVSGLDGKLERVKGVDAVNAVAWFSPDLVVASDDGVFAVQAGDVARKLASGPFSAVARVGPWFYVAGRNGVLRLTPEKGEIRRWVKEPAVRVAQPTSLASCGDHLLCIGAADGLRKYRIDPEDGHLGELPGGDALPEPFVTAVSSGPWDPMVAGDPWTRTAWAATLGGGLVALGERPMTPADGLPDGRISPRALAVKDGVAFAGTPNGLLVVRGRSAALVPVGGPVTAVAVSGRSGIWIGLPGQVIRLEVEIPAEPQDLQPWQARVSMWSNP